MGNTVQGESPSHSRRWGQDDNFPVEHQPQRRDISPIPRFNQPPEMAKEYTRSKSVKDIASLNKSGLLDNSISCRGRTNGPYKNLTEELHKSNHFCQKFILTCQEVKMNANFGVMYSFLNYMAQGEGEKKPER